MQIWGYSGGYFFWARGGTWGPGFLGICERICGHLGAFKGHRRPGARAEGLIYHIWGIAWGWADVIGARGKRSPLAKDNGGSGRWN